jgi:cytoskeletal protein RodZ
MMSAELNLRSLNQLRPLRGKSRAPRKKLQFQDFGNQARAKNVASFGENLRQAREARNITLQDIAASTKISTRALKALEDEHFNQLPGGIFNRGFVRAYARFVGLDEENAVAEYLAAAKVPPSELDMQSMSTQVLAGGTARQPWAPNAASVVGVVAVIVALGLGALWLNEHRKEARDQEARHKAEVLMSAAAPVPAVQPKVEASEQSAAPQGAAKDGELNANQNANQGANQSGASQGAASIVVPSVATDAGASTSPAAAPAARTAMVAAKGTAPVEVSISAKARAWISVRSDGKAVETLTLDPDEPELKTRSYTAKEKLILVVGNPGALSVTYNGKPTGTLGPSGERATVTFTPEGMEKQ